MAILAFPEATASTVYGMYDLLISAGRDWETLIEGVPSESRLGPRVVARGGRTPIQVGNGIVLTPDLSLDECPCPEVVCIPELLVPPDLEVLADNFAEELDWLRKCHAQGSIFATVCSGAVLLAEAGLRVARLNLIDWHEIGQQPFATLARSKQKGDALIGDVQAWIGENYAVHSPVAAMTRRSGLPDRSFVRRFKQATGLSPLEYVHTLRLEEAKQLLEATPSPVEAIANECGYEDAGYFGRLFSKHVGLTPAQYRRRFGSIRRALVS